jgi:hypothetical protein
MRNGAFIAQLGKLITCHVVCRTGRCSAYVELRGRRGGLKRLDLGSYDTMKGAKRVCDLHCAIGCDLSNAERIIQPARVGKP